MRMINLSVVALLLILVCTVHSSMAGAEKYNYSSDLLDQINHYRLKNKLNQLQADATLMELARQHSMEMYRAQQMSHKGFEQRFEQADSHLCVENVGWNYRLPKELFDGWRHSPVHRRNMLKKGVQRVGIAEMGKYVTFIACK